MTLTKVVLPEYCSPTRVSSISSFQNSERNQSSSRESNANMAAAGRRQRRPGTGGRTGTAPAALGTARSLSARLAPAPRSYDAAAGLARRTGRGRAPQRRLSAAAHTAPGEDRRQEGGAGRGRQWRRGRSRARHRPAALAPLVAAASSARLCPLRLPQVVAACAGAPERPPGQAVPAFPPGEPLQAPHHPGGLCWALPCVSWPPLYWGSGSVSKRRDATCKERNWCVARRSSLIAVINTDPIRKGTEPPELPLPGAA